MWVYFNVPESEYLKYAQNNPSNKQTPVRLKLADGSIYEHQGVIDAIEADFDNHTGTIEMRASFPNPDQFEILDQSFVYVLDSENKLATRHINIAAELPNIYLVSDGLAPSDTILIEGLRRVSNGDEIEPELISASDTLAELSLHAE